MSALISEPTLVTDAAWAALRMYVAEWTALLRAARLGLGERATGVLVHAALTVINDLARTPHLRIAGYSLQEDLVAMALAVLFADCETTSAAPD
jgi:hypothetical protein